MAVKEINDNDGELLSPEEPEGKSEVIPKVRITPSQAAKLLGISIKTIRVWCKKGFVPYFRTPSHHRSFDQAEVLALLDSMHYVPPKK